MKQKTDNKSIGTNTCDTSSNTQNSKVHTTMENNQGHTTGIHCDIQEIDFSEFPIREAANREKVEALMCEYFDDDGNPRKKTAAGTTATAEFNWDLYV